ncbi:MAG: hypothetical protein AB1705_28310 [Verrucomicrobiota bacterium]
MPSGEDVMSQARSRKRVSWRVLLSACSGVVALLAVVAILLQEPEPTYQEKPLSDWLGNRRELEKAVAHIGTNAVPWLLRAARADRDTAFHRMHVRLWSGLSPGLKRRYARFRPASPTQERANALAALWKLGPEASPNIELIRDLAMNGGHPMVSGHAGNCLAVLAAENTEAARVYVQVLNSLDATNRSLLLGSVINFNRCTPEVMPVVMANLQQWTAGRAPFPPHNEFLVCGILGPHAAPAVPYITRALGDGALKENAMAALRYIGPDAAAAVPSLIEALRGEPQPAALEALMNIGSPAESALPELNRLAGHEESVIRVFAAMARARITRDNSSAVPILERELIAPAPQGKLSWNAGVLTGLPVALNGCQTAAWFLGELGPVAKPVVPLLLEQMSGSDAWLSAISARSVWRITGDESQVISVLIQLAQGRNTTPRILAIQTMGEIGPRASSSIPVIESVQSNDLDTFREARRALRRIVPKDDPDK